MIFAHYSLFLPVLAVGANAQPLQDIQNPDLLECVQDPQHQYDSIVDPDQITADLDRILDTNDAAEAETHIRIASTSSYNA